MTTTLTAFRQVRELRHSKRGCAALSPIAARMSVLVLTGAVALAACGGSNHNPNSAKNSPAKLIAAAISAQKAGNLGQARTLLGEALQQQPGNVYAHYDLGVLDQGAGDPSAALAEYRAALMSDPGYVPALYNEATILAASNRAEAMAIYREIVQLQPTAPTAYLNLGLLEVATHQESQGLKDLLTALHQDPALMRNIPAYLVVPLSQAAKAESPTRPTPSPSPS